MITMHKYGENWTDEEVANIGLLHGDGLSVGDIAEKIGASPYQIVGVLWLKFKIRASVRQRPQSRRLPETREGR